jgi:hypothetical protein
MTDQPPQGNDGNVDRDSGGEPSEGAFDTGLPTLAELLAETGETSAEEDETRWQDEREFDNKFEVSAVDVERAWAHLEGLQDHYRHKKNWSTFLMGILAGMVGFQWILLAMVGWAQWDFSKYEWLLPILLVQNLGQIIGLAFVVVKSLFRDLDSRI